VNSKVLNKTAPGLDNNVNSVQLLKISDEEIKNNSKQIYQKKYYTK